MHRKRTGLALLSLAGLILATLGTLAAPATAGRKTTTSTGSTTTGQAIWTNFKPSGNTFGFTETATYTFDEATAAAAYGTPTAALTATTCTGGGSNAGQTCNGTYNPGAPGAGAAPLFPGVPNGDKCLFWTGGDLSDVTKTVQVTSASTSGSGTWKYTYTWTWNGTRIGSDNPDDNETGTDAWYIAGIEADNGGVATVIFTGKIAGLSAQRNSAGQTKYSFSLLNSDGTARISNVKVTSYERNLDGSTGAFLAEYLVDSSVIDAYDESLGDVDPNFAEFGVGATYGLSTLMAQTGSAGILTIGDARGILNGDTFAGNNDGGSTGAALAYLQLAATHVDLPEGDFKVILTATVKGIDGNADVRLEVTSNLRIFGLGSCA